MSEAVVRLTALVRKLARDVSVAHHGTIMPGGHIEQELDEIHALHAREGDAMQHIHARLDRQWARIEALEKAAKASEASHPDDDVASRVGPPEPKENDPPAAEAEHHVVDEDEEKRHQEAQVAEAQRHVDADEAHATHDDAAAPVAHLPQGDGNEKS